MATIPAVSTEYLYLSDVRAFDSRSPDSVTDPTTLSVSVAFVVGDRYPVDADWHVAEWDSPTAVRILVGPDGGLALPEGNYNVWLRVTGAIEQPRRAVGFLRVGGD